LLIGYIHKTITSLRQRKEGREKDEIGKLKDEKAPIKGHGKAHFGEFAK
jgi:hypothetical protein